jgi:uncharacterized membrane protein
MEKIFKVFLVFHIISGFTAFVAAPVAMSVAKGGQKHRTWGRIFFWAMTGVCSSGFVMSVLHSNLFLFMISGFSYYLVVSGYRWLYRKKIQSVKDIALIDWIIVAAAGIFNLSLLCFGLYTIYKAPGNAFGYISSVFGLLGINFVRTNVKQFYHPPAKNAWLLNHIGGMIGGYIATVSAFSAVNFNFLPTIIQWLWPTIIGVPLLLMWINFYKRKFKAGKKISELVELKIEIEI